MVSIVVLIPLYQRQKFITVCVESRNMPVTAKNRENSLIPQNTAKFFIYRDKSRIFYNICIIIPWYLHHNFMCHFFSSKFEQFPRNHTSCYKYQTRCYNLSAYTTCYKIRQLVITSGESQYFLFFCFFVKVQVVFFKKQKYKK